MGNLSIAATVQLTPTGARFYQRSRQMTVKKDFVLVMSMKANAVFWGGMTATASVGWTP